MPEVIDDFDAQANVPHKFSGAMDGACKALRVIVVFPELSDVVKKHAGQEEIPGQDGVDGGDGFSAPGHLGGVFKETTTAGMMKLTGGGGTLPFGFELLQSPTGHGAQAWFPKLGKSVAEIIPVFLKGLLALWGALEEGVPLFLGHGSEEGGGDVESIGVLGEIPGQVPDFAGVDSGWAFAGLKGAGV